MSDKLTAVVAADLNGAIGSCNKIPWKLPGDLKRFKGVTMGGLMITGRKTRESIGCALPGRVSIVVSTIMQEGKVSDNEYYVTSPEEALALARKLKGDTDTEIFVVGGGTIYEELLPFCTHVNFTQVIEKINMADTWFKLSGLWTSKKETWYPADDANPLSCRVYELERASEAKIIDLTTECVVAKARADKDPHILMWEEELNWQAYREEGFTHCMIKGKVFEIAKHGLGIACAR